MSAPLPPMRGYFAIGLANADKPGNLGNLVRTAHAFGAAFVFSIGTYPTKLAHKFDTSKSDVAMPVYDYERFEDLKLPKRCRLVGIELDDDAVDLPSFRHPEQAAYILGGERIGLSEDILTACDHIVKIPTRFSLNVATAGAIVMYDRMKLLGRFPNRPVTPSGKVEPTKRHVHGGPIFRHGKPGTKD